MLETNWLIRFPRPLLAAADRCIFKCEWSRHVPNDRETFRCELMLVNHQGKEHRGSVVGEGSILSLNYKVYTSPEAWISAETSATVAALDAYKSVSHMFCVNRFFSIHQQTIKSSRFAVSFRGISRMRALLSSICDDSNFAHICVQVIYPHKGDKQANQSSKCLI